MMERTFDVKIYNRKSYIFVCLFIAFVMLTNNSLAQEWEDVEEPLKASYWMNIGLGMNSLGSYSGIVSISAMIPKTLITLRAIQNSERTSQSEGSGEFFDIAFLIGSAQMSSGRFFSIAAGISKVSGYRYIGPTGPYNSGMKESINSTLGLPVEMQFFFRPGENYGLGIYVYGNINMEQSFGGVTFCVQFGDFE